MRVKLCLCVAINFNDGFGGDHHIEHNLIFNTCRGEHCTARAPVLGQYFVASFNSPQMITYAAGRCVQSLVITGPLTAGIDCRS